jgi:hypothetical protein
MYLVFSCQVIDAFNLLEQQQNISLGHPNSCDSQIRFTKDFTIKWNYSETISLCPKGLTICWIFASTTNSN